MAGRTISNGTDLLGAEHADPQFTITRPDQAIINTQMSRQTQHTTEISESMDLHLIEEDVLY